MKNYQVNFFNYNLNNNNNKNTFLELKSKFLPFH